MIVPHFWAESRLQHRENGRQISLRRFGWSDTSQQDAQAHADARAREALQRLLAGEPLPRREPKTAYNGAAGIPIREEILSTHDDTVITRNAYGARCLNTPDILFADLDFPTGAPLRLTLLVFLAGLALAGVAGWISQSATIGIPLALLTLVLSGAVARALQRASLALTGGPERRARKRIDHFLKKHPAWNLRLYRTPAGLRVLATHQPFSPNAPEVAACFRALGTDPVYAAMCLNQQCFRARLSAKPWRIGIQQHLRPRPGVWPVAPEHLPIRQAWVETYERKARAYAACAFLESLGSGKEHPKAQAVAALHDELSAARRNLPLA